MGPSGSGKSTLLAVLSGLLQPDRRRGAGRTAPRTSGRCPSRQRERFPPASTVGFIFQGYNLFPALTARQQLEMVLRWGEGTPAKERGNRPTKC